MANKNHTIIVARRLLSESDAELRVLQKKWEASKQLDDLEVLNTARARYGLEPVFPGLADLRNYNTYLIRRNKDPILPEPYFRNMFETFFSGLSSANRLLSPRNFDERLVGEQRGNLPSVEVMIRYRPWHLPLLSVQLGNSGDNERPNLMVYGSNNTLPAEATIAARGYITTGRALRLDDPLLYDYKKILRLLNTIWQRNQINY